MKRKIKKLWFIVFLLSALGIGKMEVAYGQVSTEPNRSITNNAEIKVRPIVQVSLEPVVGLAKFIPNQRFYTRRIERKFSTLNSDSTVNGFVSVPYQAVLNFEISLQGDSDSLHLIDSIELYLNVRLAADTPRTYLVPLPVIQNPAFATYSRFVSSTSHGARKNQEIFQFSRGELLKKDTASMHFEILAPKSFPGYFYQREFILPKFTYGTEDFAFKVSGKANAIPLTNNIYITDQSGVLVMLDEVIDPENSLTFSIDKVKLFAKGIELEQQTLDTIYKMTVKFASNLPEIYQKVRLKSGKKFLRIYRDFPSRYFTDSSRIGLYDDGLAFRTVSTLMNDSLNQTVATANLMKLYELFEYTYSTPEGEHVSTLSLDPQSQASEQGKSLGFVSTIPRDGFVPLFRGKPHNDSMLQSVYSLCLHQISNHTGYYVEDILCYVIPPLSGRNPCPPN